MLKSKFNDYSRRCQCSAVTEAFATPHRGRSPTLHLGATVSNHYMISQPNKQCDHQSSAAAAMKAIHISRFTDNLPDIVPSNTATPTPKGKQTIHIQVTHAAVTHVDLLYAQGLHQNNKRHVTPPFILGTEFAGIVLSAPPSSTIRPGTRVFGGGLGAFAEQICVAEDSVRRVPRQWSNAEACAVGASGAVSYGALHGVARLQAGESVCVLGASGGLGVMAVQIAKARGAHVIAVVGSDVKADVVRRCGADEVVLYTEPRWEDAVRDKSPGAHGVDVVYDAIGAVESGIKCLKYRGRLVIVGFAARGGKMENVRANRILLKSAMVHGYVSLQSSPSRDLFNY